MIQKIVRLRLGETSRVEMLKVGYSLQVEMTLPENMILSIKVEMRNHQERKQAIFLLTTGHRFFPQNRLIDNDLRHSSGIAGPRQQSGYKESNDSFALPREGMQVRIRKLLP